MNDVETQLAKKIKSGEIDWESFKNNTVQQLQDNWILACCGEEYMPEVTRNAVQELVQQAILRL